MRRCEITFIVAWTTRFWRTIGQDDLRHHIWRQFGPKFRDRFWVIQEQLFQELGYWDYLGALQRFRVEHPYAKHLVTASNFLIDCRGTPGHRFDLDLASNIEAPYRRERLQAFAALSIRLSGAP